MGQKVIDTRWVCSTKENGELKARLVARGFQDPDLDTLIKDSPTCHRESLRLALTISASSGWKSAALDVKTAFLQGFPIDRGVFLKPTTEFQVGQDKLLKLKKCVYGLSDASRQWFERVKLEVSKLGFSQSESDPCVFLYKQNGTLKGFLLSHVDDFWVSGTDIFIEFACSRLSAVFEIGKRSDLPCTYLGLSVEWQENAYKIKLNKFCENLQQIQPDVLQQKTSNGLLTAEQERSLRSILGKLLWPAVQTRPDLAFAVSYYSSVIKTAGITSLIAVNKLVGRLCNSEHVNLLFKSLGSKEYWRLLCFTDASFNNFADGSTQAGYLIFLYNHVTTLDCNLIAWKSFKLRRIASSTVAAETFAAVQALEACLELQNTLSHAFNVFASFKMFTDSKSLFETVYSSNIISDKRLRVDIGFMREALMTSNRLQWIATKYQLADALTKLRSSTINCLLDVLQRNSLSGIIENET